MKKGGLIDDIRKLPKGVLLAVFSIALYRVGWAAADPIFSIYIESIVNNYALVGILLSIITLVSAALTIPIGAMADHLRQSTLIRIGQLLLYPATGIAYFLAGYLQSTPFLIAALVIHGISIPFVWTVGESYIRTQSTQAGASRAFGLFDSSKALFIVGMIIASFFIDSTPLHFLFLPIVVFSLISGFFSRNLPSRRPKPSFDKILKQIRTHHSYLKDVAKDVATFNSEMYTAMLLNLFLRYVTALGTFFIPLYAIEQQLPLSRIILLMAFMQLPALFGFIFAEIADRGEKIATIMAGIAIAGLGSLGLYLWGSQSWAIFGFSFVTMVGASMINPCVYGIITNLSLKKFNGLNTALQNIMARLGSAISTLTLGLVSSRWGIELNFLVLTFASLIVIIVLHFLRLRWKLKNKLWHKNHPKGIHAPYSL